MCKCYCFLMFMWGIIVECGCPDVTQFFASSPLCRDSSKDFNGCSERVFSGPDKTSCLVRCQTSFSCVGVSEDIFDINYCFLHFVCQKEMVKVCGMDDIPARYYSKNCAHGGRWSPSDNKCRCVNGWVGSTCQDLPQDYTDLMDSGYEQGTYWAYYDLRDHGQGLIPVLIYFNPKTMYGLVQILFNNGNTSFNLSWTEFRKGFFKDEFNMWAGLDVWSSLSRAGYGSLYAILGFRTSGHVYRWYRGFILSDASDDFRITINSKQSSFRVGTIAAEANFGDCFGPHQGIPFSTFDRDLSGNNDKNCAARMGSGWWYGGDCFKACNLFGWGPSHWGSIPAGQRLSVLGVPERYITQDEFKVVNLYVTK